MYLISGISLATLAAGGALGAVARALVSRYCHTTGFPISTLIVNCAGSFMMGLAYCWLIERISGNEIAEMFRAIIMTGFLGALTTFSTFSLDAFLLFSHGYVLRAVLYIALSIVGSLIALWAGVTCMRTFC